MLNDKIESNMRKKVIIVVVFIVATFVSVFADKEPRIELLQQGGKLVESGGVLDRPYVGYNTVRSEHVGFWFWEKVRVECKSPGVNVCKAVIDGVAVLYLYTPDDKKSYGFDSSLIMAVVDKMIEEIEQIPIGEDGRTGEKSKTISVYDEKGVKRLILIRCIYNMDKTLRGSTSIYMNVIE